MKKTILLFGFIAMLSSCNSGRIAELEAENMELMATVEMLKAEAELARNVVERQVVLAQEALRRAEVQYTKAQEAAESANK